MLRLGKTIQRKRVEKGLSQEELAFRAQTSQTTISRIEINFVTPSWRLINSIAAALEVPLSQLIAQAEKDAEH